MELKSIFVLKFPKIIQCLFYFLQYQKREDICERGTNRLLWKRAKAYINEDLFAKMSEHWPCGPKDHNFLEYERLGFIKKCLAEYNLVEVDDYSIALGKLMRWIIQAIELRTEDVRQRREGKAQLRQFRANKIKEEEERMERRAAAFEEAKAKHDEEVQLEKAMRKEQEEAEDGGADDKSDVPDFDGEGWYQQFDEENPPIEIPDEVKDDVDNDFNIIIEEHQPEE